MSANRAGTTPKFQGGFTLVELMIVIVILSVLAALVLPNIMGRPDEARIVVTRADIRTIANALALYKLDNLAYPTTNQGLEALVSGTTGNSARSRDYVGYLNKVPKDPWGNDYRYLSPGAHGPYDLYSLGADAREGGSGVNAEITSWED